MDIYNETFDVRIQEIDGWKRLKTSSLLQYMEQTVTNMTIAAGFDHAWYAQQGTAWVMRQMHVERLAPATYRDKLTVSVWVSTIQKVRLNIEYEVRLPDGSPVGVGRSEWVYIDRENRRPRSLDEAIKTGWPMGEQSSLWSRAVTLPEAQLAAPQDVVHTMARRVNYYEAEELGVTNNTAYAAWLEEAARAALRSWGYFSGATTISPTTLMDTCSLAIQYSLPTRPDDQVVITTTLSGVEGNLIAVAQQIHNEQANQGDSATTKPLIEAKTTYQLEGGLSVDSGILTTLPVAELATA